MAASIGPTENQLIQRLEAIIPHTPLHQVVRLLNLILRSNAIEVGADGPPTREALRFRSPASLGFPVADIQLIQKRKNSTYYEIVTAIGALTGPTGALPDHYTVDLISRVRSGDLGMHEFFDLFHHRLVSFLYQAWKKHHVAASYEWSRLANDHDRFTTTLRALTGIAYSSSARRLKIGLETVVYYSGAFCRGVRSAIDLEAMLKDHLSVPIRINQFEGSWTTIDAAECSRLGSSVSGSTYSELGVNLVAGSRVFDISSRFRVQIGPLNYAQFVEFLPRASQANELASLIRLYCGVDFDFSLQLILRAEEVPELRLLNEPESGARLGWNTWFGTDSRSIDAENYLGEV